ncbi:MAG TPA: DUF2147 domain-containing protein [Ferrovibrio sp.]|jgi:uncharacterized protein (DUF2147 family)|uniref:DUF2147 domain-containing protein n=1 Tax=Ferrovibrio sp. TaxID=1917215 RepID=UPI002ED106B9
MLRRAVVFSALSLALLLPGGSAHAGGVDDPVGLWKTIDDETNTERSLVEIRKVGDELQGRIVKIFYRPDEKPDPVCEKCEGARKNQPIIGMTFLWGLKRDGDDWAHGAILDPKNGKIYNAKVSLADDGRSLRVRGYVGTPLLGRTQVWLRQDGASSSPAAQ